MTLGEARQRPDRISVQTCQASAATECRLLLCVSPEQRGYGPRASCVQTCQWARQTLPWTVGFCCTWAPLGGNEKVRIMRKEGRHSDLLRSEVTVAMGATHSCDNPTRSMTEKPYYIIVSSVNQLEILTSNHSRRPTGNLTRFGIYHNISKFLENAHIFSTFAWRN